MKLLLFTVALVHCAFASSNGQQADKGAAASQSKDSSAEPITAVQGSASAPRLCDPCAQGLACKGDDYLPELCQECKVTWSGEKPRTTDDSPDLGGLDGGADDDELTLISCDEEDAKRLTISREDVKMCQLVNNIIEGDKVAKEIDVPKVEGKYLQFVVDYLKFHKGKVPNEIAKPIRSVKMGKIVEHPWDAAFIAITNDGDNDVDMSLVGRNRLTKRDVFEIILAANYMDIKSLLHLGCAKIATLIKGKSPEEIKKILGDDEEHKEAKDLQKESGYRRRLLEAMSNF